MADGVFAGFGVRGYRSFGSAAIQRVGPMSKIHLVVGQNNVGKSNLLHFLHDVVQKVRGGEGGPITELFAGGLDSPDGWDGTHHRTLSIGIRLTLAVRNQFRLGESGRGTLGNSNMFSIIDTPVFSPDPESDVVWFDFDFATRQNSQTVVLEPSREQLESALQQTRDADVLAMLNSLSGQLTGTSGGQPFDNYARIVGNWAPWQFIPRCSWVDAVREITLPDQQTQTGNPSSTQNGRGLIDELARLQSPDHDNYDADNAKFVALQEFTKSLLDDAQAKIIIPNSKRTILVSTKNGRKPIASLGTGISELIVLAAASTAVDDAVVCIEEPEIHLHPTLQRRFIQYIADNTDNRYLISTHSAALLNAQLASISHVTMNDKWSEIDLIRAPRALASTVADLGNRASDLVQSNFVVWVEGPSDRLYVCHWLQRFAPDLIEGSHYSVMFYGGALLSHLSADDNEVDDFIKLTRINRNLAIVIDSDKPSAEAGLNATKKRVLDELTNSGGLGWVTDAYTIENYVPTEELTFIISELYPSHIYAMPRGEWKSPLGRTFRGSGTKPSKVSVARAVVAKGETIAWPPALQNRIAELARYIRDANDLPDLECP